MARIFGNPATSSTSAGADIFRRTYEATLGARQRQAKPYVLYFLLSLDDAALDQLGYDRRILEANGGGRDPF